MNIIRLLFLFYFIAPSLAATGFGAIILRSSLIELRKTHGIYRLSLLARARAMGWQSPFATETAGLSQTGSFAASAEQTSAAQYTAAQGGGWQSLFATESEARF
jgi:hypothetical protein